MPGVTCVGVCTPLIMASYKGHTAVVAAILACT